MYGLKYAELIREFTKAEVYEFYIDMRCFGEAYEEFYKRVSEMGVNFIRGKVAGISDQAISEDEKGKLIVTAEDTLLGKMMRVPVDMVILCSALQPRSDAADVATLFTIGQRGDGFFLETHPKLAPVNTPTDGVFIAGCCEAPRDVPDTVAQASAAASNSGLSSSGAGSWYSTCWYTLSLSARSAAKSCTLKVGGSVSCIVKCVCRFSL